ncbi:ABC transporter permease subunit [Paenarthrobacter nicotinovorans]|uniref:ABC transporter permease subunit n=1 Tax=Paenarthrobacter nicotinovorans TaxID=29320 RepID=UPI0009A81DCA|nr:ABC transporter permease subunit [Paenarthrobacter nicotinovorans]MDI2021250.1 Maltose/maltodextrin transport system permease protein MalF [Paenarthrobacter nicotinovorans]SKC01939.1 carbohydrate ABC transporter membrane protein 1, CUT1 family [Arthrobacter sp. 31Cvi3.1E]
MPTPDLQELPATAASTAPPQPRRGNTRRMQGKHHPDSLKGTILKIVLLGLVDAFAVYVLMMLFLSQSWAALGVSALVVVAINWIYLRKGGLPAKYLAPGVLFLLVFQVLVVVFSGYIAFTNYGDGHNSTKDDAISAIQLTAQKRVPDSPAYKASVLTKGSDFYLLFTDPSGKAQIGSTGQALADATAAGKDSTGKANSLPGYETLKFQEIVANQQEILKIAVPVSSDPADGTLRTADGSTAYQFKPALHYDAGTDTFTDTETGTQYTDNGKGAFADSKGETLATGWKIDVGLDNFARAFTDPSLRGPLLGVIIWTFTFSVASVALTFIMGLFLAITFNREDLRGKKVYRILMILPYAFPAFLSGLVWSGILNPEFGWLNQTLLGGANIGWLTDPVLAKVSVLVVNVWLGFPYMFLVCTGALQSLPSEIDEAARMDGASAWRVFRSIKLPLLLVSVAPLLISSFAFNFNNFNVIYMLTGGGPRFADTDRDIGATDILITLVYKVAFGQGTGRDYGLASALAIIIFIIVATISAISFKQTKALEDVN